MPEKEDKSIAQMAAEAEARNPRLRRAREKFEAAEAAKNEAPLNELVGEGRANKMRRQAKGGNAGMGLPRGDRDDIEES